MTTLCARGGIPSRILKHPVSPQASSNAPKDFDSQPSPAWVLLGLALLAVLAYLPAITQPLLEDDYPNISQAATWGARSGWPLLWSNPALRFRLTSYWLIFLLHQFFGMNPAAYHSISIFLHVLNTWLVYAAGWWSPLSRRVSAWAAAFFAVYEGHQEAVMWFSACNELLLFLFCATSFLCLVRFLQGRRGFAWYAISFFAFSLALLSKESSAVFVVLLMLPLVFPEARWRNVVYWLPYAALATAGAISIIQARGNSFRFQDGSFSLHAPFWLTLPGSLLRLLWFWGLLSVGLVLARGAKHMRQIVYIGLIWMLVAMVPYSFLLYSTRIPSRQTYLASTGLAFVFGAAVVVWLRQRVHPALSMALFAVILSHNIGYLWIKKRAQFLERAEPTEKLIALARKTKGPIYVECFPRPRIIAEEALHLTTGNEVIWDASLAKRAKATFCYAEK